MSSESAKRYRKTVKGKANFRKWMKTEKGKALQARKNRKPKSRFIHLIYRANKKEILFKLTYKQFLNYITKPCKYCGDTLPETGSGLDRKDNDKGYIITNLVPCCDACNRIKNIYLTYKEMLQIRPILIKAKNRRKKVKNLLDK